MIDRERDVQIAELLGWTGPVKWVEDNPYMFAPWIDWRVIRFREGKDLRDFDSEVPHFCEAMRLLRVVLTSDVAES